MRPSQPGRFVWLILKKHTLIIWCFSDVSCEALPADPHGTYTNAKCIETKTFFNESCELACHLGYRATGDPVQTCQLDGGWSSDIHCIGETTTAFTVAPESVRATRMNLRACVRACVRASTVRVRTCMCILYACMNA